MVRIIQIYNQSPLEFPSDTILEKQEFVLRVVSDATRDRMQLIGTELIFNLEALFLRLRNFNIEIEFARKHKPNNDDIRRVLDYILLKNMQLAERSHAISHKCNRLIIDSKKTGYMKRFNYIRRSKGTIFNEKDFEPGKPNFYKLSSRPSPCTVARILKRYLDHKDSEKVEYMALIKEYIRIHREYDGNKSEWFGATSWSREAEASVAGLCRKDEMRESSVRIADQAGTTA